MAPSFYFEGKIPASKSVLNRALIIQSFNKAIPLHGNSLCDDVVFLKKALSKIESGREYYCGEGGTTLRFLAFRLSREKGEFLLKGSARLFSRPQSAIIQVLEQLGVKVVQNENSIKIISDGWREPAKSLQIPVGESSQFLSGLLLSAWGLKFDLKVSWKQAITSEGYFSLTKEMCEAAGMQVILKSNELTVPLNQKITATSLVAESDLSSLFSVAACAALLGEAKFLEFPVASKQPDMEFLKILNSMGVGVEIAGDTLTVTKAEKLSPVNVNIEQCPDLFPVLATLCSFADGKSILYGAPQLKHKESDRIGKVSELLNKLDIEHQPTDDGMEIFGNSQQLMKSFSFDPDHDHRMAMAAGLLSLYGHQITLTDSQVVNKSFPEFWNVLGLGPIAIVGHRGTGKSTFLQRIRIHLPNWTFVDLDQEIVNRSGKSIEDIFAFEGEEEFRKLEISLLKDLEKTLPLNSFIATGAGIRTEKIPLQMRILWLRRDTDGDGRIFLDRPRLNTLLSPLSEFRSRAIEREEKFQKRAQSVYTMIEGQTLPDSTELKAVQRNWQGLGGCITLGPSDLVTIPPGGADYYELRDDLLDSTELSALFQKLPAGKIIYSVRTENKIPTYIINSDCMIDWALEVGFPQKDLIDKLGERLIISSHSHCLKEALLDIKIFSLGKMSLKLAPIVESFEELRRGHQWVSGDPSRRSFLPRSHNGRWAWYRLLMKGKMKINFFREGTGSSIDQPTVLQWMKMPMNAQKFGAVIGSPVKHSYSPIAHENKDFPFFAIDMELDEFDQAMPVLKELGLNRAAVTSPLKGKAFSFAQIHSEISQQFQVANTLKLDNGQWFSHNTDLGGLLELRKHVKGDQSIGIWGGGGTKPLLENIFAGAYYYSSTGRVEQNGRVIAEQGPDVLIWAAPRGDMLRFPPESWRPKMVVDLNYKEDSAGLEYAAKIKAQYISGKEMFYEQARLQQEFWKD